MNGSFSGQSVADYHKHLGLSVFEEKNYGRAFAHLSLALCLNPEWKVHLQEVYFACLNTWCEQLESEGKLNELFLCYEQALSAYSHSVDAHFSLANQLNRLGFSVEAAKFYKRCLALDENHVGSHHNLVNLYNKLVERWHFRMLNDKVRNDSYKKAITNRIAQGHNHVLDIGTGTGLLSLFAVESGAKKVYACDHSPIMVQMAAQVFKTSASFNKIKLIEKSSTDLIVPDDLQDRVSLVVTETMDAGVFGENLLETVIHAWSQLLITNTMKNEASSSPWGCIIPQAVTIYAVPIQSAFLSKKYRYDTTQQKCSLYLPNYVALLEEPYDSEDLRKLANNVCYLSKPKKIMTVDLNSPQELLRLRDNKISELKTIKMTCCGRIDAFVCFFRACLDDNTTISTSPLETENVADSWEQAVFPSLNPLYVTVDEEIVLSVSCFEGKVNLRWPNEIKTQGNEPEQNFLSQNSIRLLNDSQLMSGLIATAVELSEWCKASNTTQISVLDLSPLPLLSLLLIQQLESSKNIKSHLMYLREDETVENFVKLYLDHNGLTSVDLKSFHAKDLYSFFLQHEKTYDIIVVNNLVLSDGSLNERMFISLPVIRKNLKRNGKILPERLTCVGQLINCDWLSKVSSVVAASENDIFGIAAVINQFQVPLHYGLNLETLEYTPLSNEFQLFSINMNEISEEKLQTIMNVNVSRPGLLGGAAIWLVLHFCQEKSIAVSMKASDSSVDQFASLMSPPIHVTESMSLNVTTLFHKGLVKININS